MEGVATVEARQIDPCTRNVRLAGLSAEGASSWMRDMGGDGYALTKRLETTLYAKRRDAERVARGDPCTPGTRGRGPAPQPSSAR